jgi:hypothetical protein
MAFALGLPGVAFAADVPAGQILFVSGVVKIVDAAGVERLAKKGDKILPDEHMVTAGGAIGQIKMPDGSLIGVRPDSDLKFDKPKAGDGRGVDERIVFLSKGAVRIVNVEGGQDKPLPLMLQTPTASIGLRNADNESVVVQSRAAGGATPLADPGTYSRMTIGVGMLKTAAGETPLAPSQTGFAALGSAALPTRIAALPNLVVTPPAAVPGAALGGPLTGRVAAPAIGPVTLGPAPAIVDAGFKLPPPTLSPIVISPMTPVTVAPIAPIIIQPITPPTLVNTGSIDFTNVAPAKLANLPSATLVQLPPTLLATLPPATLSNLPLTTIKGLPATTQLAVTPLLTPIQQTNLILTPPPPVITKTIIPITTTTTFKATTLKLLP